MNIDKYSEIFLDRDGVINEVIYRDAIISSPRSLKEFIFRPEIFNFIENFKDNKNFYVVTNQPDISRGLLSKKILNEMHEKIALKLNIKEIIYCPHTDSDQCDFRKPNPGMINKLIEKYKLNKKNCLMIGDTKKDQDAAKNAKISSVLIKTKYNQDLSNVNFIDSLSNFKQ